MTDLLPCPFCGGEAELRPNDRGIYTPDIYGWHVECTNDECIIGLMDDRQWFEETKAEAIAAWNTRSAGTCEVTTLHSWDGDEIAQYCGCGCLLEAEDNFCPNCGRKVTA